MKNNLLTYYIRFGLPATAATLLLFGCADSESENNTLNSAVTASYSSTEPVDVNLLNNHIQNNDAAYIPAQCYTQTVDANNKVHNPCFSCHTQGQTPNYINDSDFQLSYDFTTYSRTNHWQNLFLDRTEAIANIDDDSILQYIRTSNYFENNGEITLANQLQNVPSQWDFDQNGEWDGYTPDCYFNFDNEGFDRNQSDVDTGWRAFAYTPLLGTFWPTNGSTDDVIIRLPENMRQDADGNYSRTVYKLNLAIVEAMITRKNVGIEATDENLYNEDLNRNGVLDNAVEIVFEWAPTEGKDMSYVGKAKALQSAGELHLAAGLYPEGTEFLHTVRYIDVDQNSGIQLADRIKELRYAKKMSWNSYSQLYNAAMGEELEAEQFPDRLRTIVGNAETGIINGLGWVYQGFIEDQTGALRPQSFEESMTCVGCHSGIGVTTDSSFAFPRKLVSDAYQAGWYHWSQNNIEGIEEPKWSDGTWEYSKYLEENHSANEFRDNQEVIAKFFDSNGNLKPSEIETLHTNIAHLLVPSQQRALELNKAYKVIVEEQSYIYGRDPHIKPVTTSWDIVPIDEVTGITEPVIRN